MYILFISTCVWIEQGSIVSSYLGKHRETEVGAVYQLSGGG